MVRLALLAAAAGAGIFVYYRVPHPGRTFLPFPADIECAISITGDTDGFPFTTTRPIYDLLVSLGLRITRTIRQGSDPTGNAAAAVTPHMRGLKDQPGIGRRRRDSSAPRYGRLPGITEIYRRPFPRSFFPSPPAARLSLSILSASGR